MENTFTEKKRKNDKPSNVGDTTNLNKEDFHFIDGKRYHNPENSKYVLPVDDDECERLNLIHVVFRCAWQGNFASPVEHILKSKGAKVLDTGYISL